MNQKKMLIIIAAVAAAVVLATVGIILGVALSNNYLDSMKKYDYSSNDYNFYNGIEIVAEDGLFYLTKDGKKISETGYSYLSSVNEAIDLDLAINRYDIDDYEIYDYYVARRPDAKNYFLVKGDGTEIAIEGDSLALDRINLPYVAFKDYSTGRLGAVSLKNLDSDMSSNAGSEIALDMFDALEFCTFNPEHVQCDYVIAYLNNPGDNSLAYTYFDAKGLKLFDSAQGAVTPICLSDGDKITSYYFYVPADYDFDAGTGIV